MDIGSGGTVGFGPDEEYTGWEEFGEDGFEDRPVDPESQS